MLKNYCIVTTSCNNKDNAKEITEKLLEKRLVSYVQESKRFSSYWWNGSIVREDEYVLTMGTKKELFGKLKKEIQLLHKYEVPAIVMYDIIDANSEILDWIDTETE